jgi:hypothetical protein
VYYCAAEIKVDHADADNEDDECQCGGECCEDGKREAED